METRCTFNEFGKFIARDQAQRNIGDCEGFACFTFYSTTGIDNIFPSIMWVSSSHAIIRSRAVFHWQGAQVGQLNPERTLLTLFPFDLMATRFGLSSRA